MGNEASVHIYLDKMDGNESKANHYSIVVSNKIFEKCNFFKKVTYEITYQAKFPRVQSSTEFYIYIRKRSWTVVDFTYYPYYESDVIVTIYCFYSILRMDEPLVLGFTTKGNVTKYYRYVHLDSTSSTGLPSRGFDESDLVRILWEENENLNRKFTFKVGSGKNININGIPGEDEPKYNYSGNFKRVLRKANIDPEFSGSTKGPWQLYSRNLFTINPSKNKIEDESIRVLDNLTFYAVNVYYTASDDLAVLIELVRDFNDTIFIARKDMDGNCWDRVKIHKANETDFDGELQILQNDFTHPWLYNRGRSCKPIKYKVREPAKLEYCDPSKPRPPVVDSDEETRPPSPPPKRAEEEELPKHKVTPERKTPTPVGPPPVEIDISKLSGSTYGKSNNITVSQKNPYNSCDLFCYYTHNFVKRSIFAISSFVSSSGRIKVTHSIKTLNNVKSVNVYFNIYHESNPLMIEVSYNNSRTEFYDVLKTSDTYNIKHNRSISRGSVLSDRLIELNDKNNGMFTFQIDRTEDYNNIDVRLDMNSSHFFTIYRHNLDGLSPNWSFILFQRRLLVIDSSTKAADSELQNKKYDSINVYVLNTDYSFPLLIELKQSGSRSIFFSRKTSAGTFKKLDDFRSSVDSEVKSKLSESYYFFKKSIILDVSKSYDITYSVRLIENEPQSNSLAPLVSDYAVSKISNSFNEIKVRSKRINCSTKSFGSFKCYQHDLSELKLSQQSHEVAGLRLYLAQSLEADDMVEIQLYKSNDIKVSNREFIHYIPFSDHGENKNKFNVYFNGDDTRPLLFTYNDRAYLQIHNNQWYYDNKIDCKNECKILDKLYEIFEKLKGKLVFVINTRSDLNINKSTGKPFDKFFKDSYTPLADKNKEYHLSKYTLFDQENTRDSNIHKFLDKLHRITFDSVNVYREKKSSSLQDILLIEFVSEPQRTHFKRRDSSGRYWVETRVDQITEENLKQELNSIKNSIQDSVVFEIDSTDKHYSQSVYFAVLEDDPTSGYNKFIQMSNVGHPNFALLMYKNNKLVIKEKSGFTTLEQIEYKNYSNVTVYFTSENNEGKDQYPLLIELNKSETSSVSNVYYAHRKTNNKYYWEKISVSYTKYDEQPLIDKLDEIKYEFLDSIVVLMGKNNIYYGESEIKAAIQPTLTKEFNLPNFESESIRVRDVGSKVSCFAKFGFKARGHDITSVKNYRNCSLRFYIPSGFNSDRYVELPLYSSNGQKREKLFFRGDFNSVHVYFYGGDPRPLMICYADRAYKPRNFNEYFTKWYRDDTVNFCLCKYSGQNQYLVDTLTTLICNLNVVDLDRKPKTTNQKDPNQPGSEKEIYDAHDFNTERVKIRVTYENGSCYRVYHHESNGFNDSGHGYRLGNIKLKTRTDTGLNYRLSRPLTRVSMYYNLFDVGHEYPILVSLRFADGSSDYYELIKFPQFTWKFIEDDVDESDVEGKAYEILKKLDIKFDRKTDAKTLFKTDDCKEGGTNAAVIGGSVGGVVSTAAVGGGVTVAVRPELIFTSIRALI